MQDRCILCVDPDDETREETIAGLRSELETEIAIRGAESLADASAVCESRPVECVVSEFDLPDGNGLDLFERVRTERPDVACILFTDTSHDAIETERGEELIVEYLQKETPHARRRLGTLVGAAVAGRPQTSYPLPQDEEERRAALRSYDLDSDRLQDSLARITDLAAMYLDVPLASVNILEEHEQEFLVCHGVESPWDALDRESAVCTFTVLEDSGVMTVEDLQADPRFEHEHDLHELGLRAYIGATLTTEAGLAIGTLCAYDETPRPFSDDERAYIEKLAGVTMDLIDAHNLRDRGAPTPAGEGQR